MHHILGTIMRYTYFNVMQDRECGPERRSTSNYEQSPGRLRHCKKETNAKASRLTRGFYIRILMAHLSTFFFAERSASAVFAQRKKWLTAFCAFRGLSHHSTTQNAGGLNFWVRNETRCGPTALTVKPRPWRGVLYIIFSKEAR